MPTIGSGKFPYPNSSAVPDVPADILLLTQRVDKMASGYTICADAAARAALVTNSDAYEGLHVYQIDTKVEWLYTSSAWVPASASAILGRVVRSSATPALASGAFGDLSTTANWSTTAPQAQNVGFAAYSNGWTIPVTGVYRISYQVLSAASIAILCGITINKSSSVATTDLRVASTASPVQSVSAPGGSEEIYLVAADVLRLFAISASGTPALSASQGSFTVEWVRPV